MQTLRNLYRIGRGPSSSHTIGPDEAARYVMKTYPQANEFQVEVYNSLALTGEGHLTFQVIKDRLKNVTIKTKVDPELHPNTLIFYSYHNDELLGTDMIISVGGGEIEINGKVNNYQEIYSEKSFDEIAKFCKHHKLNLAEYVYHYEGDAIKTFLQDVWNAMVHSINEGLSATGTLPGKLKVARKAAELYRLSSSDASRDSNFTENVCSYAFAVSEQNASGGYIVTAPTCGASGVLPAVLYYLHHDKAFSEEKIIDALAVAGVIGNVIKSNATISGAVGGCQAEIGSACAMAAAAVSFLMDYTMDQIEYAAEIAIEHHLGLTCDPIMGYVQIPCIERNAVAAIRALTASMLAKHLVGTRKISFDTIVATMYQTGLDMHPRYKETAEAGMAFFYHEMRKKP